MTEESKEIIGIMKDMFEGLRTEIQETNKRIDRLEKGQDEIKMTLENVTNKNIGALVDGHIQNTAKLDRLESIGDDVEYIKLNMGVVEAVTKVHSYDIDQLKKVK